MEYGEGRGVGKVLRGEGENVRVKGWRGDGWRGEGRRVEWARERRTCCGEGKGRVVTLDSFWPRLHNYSYTMGLTLLCVGLGLKPRTEQ